MADDEASAIYSELCRSEFGHRAAAIEGFLATRRKRGNKPDEPLRDFRAAVAAIFDHGIIVYLRTSFWEPLERMRKEKGLKQGSLAETLRGADEYREYPALSPGTRNRDG
jgi:hypothetical protein